MLLLPSKAVLFDCFFGISLPGKGGGGDTLHHARQHQIDCHQSVRSYENVSASSNDFSLSTTLFIFFKKRIIVEKFI
jgi:hypothetical protein